MCSLEHSNCSHNQIEHDLEQSDIITVDSWKNRLKLLFVLFNILIACESLAHVYDFLQFTMF